MFAALLLGVDEKSSAEQINQQLKSDDFKKLLNFVEAELKISPSDFKEVQKVLQGGTADTKALQQEMKQLGVHIGEAQEKLNFRGALEESRKALTELTKDMILDDLELVDISLSDDGYIDRMRVTWTDATEAIYKATLRFNEFGEVVDKNSTVVNQIDTVLKNYSKTVNETETELAKLLRAEIQQGETDSIFERKIDLLDDIELQYARITNTIDENLRAGIISENESQKAINAAREEYERITQVFSNYDTKLQEAQGFKTAQEHLKNYQQDLRELADLEAKASAKGLSDAEKTRVGQLKEQTSQIGVLLQDYPKLIAQQESYAEKIGDKQVYQAIIQEEKELDRIRNEHVKILEKIEDASLKLFQAEKTGKDESARQQREKLAGLEEERRNVVRQLSDNERFVHSQEAVSETITNTKESMNDLSQRIAEGTDNIARDLDEKMIAKFGHLQHEMGQFVTQDIFSDNVTKSAYAMEEFAKAVYGADAEVRRHKTVVDEYGRTMKEIQVVEDTTADSLVRKNLYLVEGTEEVRLHGEEVVKNVSRSMGFIEQLGAALDKMTVWAAAGKILQKATQEISQGFEFLHTLDKDLTSAAIVTGRLRSEVSYLTEDYMKLGQEMAKSIAEISTVNTELLRQGLALEESERRLKSILQLSSTGAISTSEALKVVTTSINAMKRGADEVGDVLLRVSNVSASNVAQLGEAFTKAASSAQAAGISLEQLTAMSATSLEVTQEGASQIGTSLKTIIARFNRVNEETGEFNKDLNDVQTAIESIGVEFLDTHGQIRNVYDILGDVADKWDDLDKNTQAYVATMAAGTRMQNRFFAIIDNFDRVVELTNEATESAGAMGKAYGIYLDSVEAAASRMQATIQGMWANIIEPEQIKMMYDFITAILKFVDKVGVMRIALVALGVTLIKKNKVLGEFLENLASGIVASPRFVSAVSKIIPTFEGGTAAVKGFEIAVKGLASVGFMLLVQGLLKIIQHTRESTAAMEEYKRSLGDNINNLIDHTDSLVARYTELYESEQDDLETKLELIEIEKELQKALGGTTDELNLQTGAFNDNIEIIDESIAEKNREALLLAIDDFEAAKKFFETEGHSSLLGEYLTPEKEGEELLEFLEELRLKQKELEAVDKSAFAGNRKAITDHAMEYSNLLGTISATETRMKELSESMDKHDEAMMFSSQKIAQNIIVEEKLESQLRELEDSFKEGSISMEEYGLKVEELSEQFAERIETHENLKNSEEATSVAMEYGNEIIERRTQVLKEALENDGDFDGSVRASAAAIIEAQQAYEASGTELAKLNTLIQDVAESNYLHTDSIDEIVSSYPELIQYLDDEKKLEEELIKIRSTKTMDKYNKDLKDVSSSMQRLVNIQHELNETEEISLELAMEIMDNYPEMIHLLGDREALEHAISEALIEQEEVQYEVVSAMLDNDTHYFNEKIRGNQELNDILYEAYGNDLEGFNTVADAKAKTDEKLRAWIGTGWNTLYGSQSEALRAQISSLSALSYADPDMQRAVNDQISAMRAQLNAVNALSGAFKTTFDGFTSKSLGAPKTTRKSGGGGGGSRSSGSTKKDVEETIDEIQIFLDELAASTEIFTFNIAMNQLDQAYFDVTDNVNELTKAMMYEKNLYSSLNTMIGHNIDAIEAKMKTVEHESEDYFKLQDALYGLRQEYRQNEIAIENLDQALQEYAKTLRQTVIDAENLIFDTLVKSITEQKKYAEKEIQALEKERDEKIKEAEKQKDEELKQAKSTADELLNIEIERLRKEKQLLREAYNERNKEKAEQKKLEKLQKLEERFAKISQDTSGVFEKEKLQLTQDIADLREEIYEDELLKEIEAKEKALDGKIEIAQQEKQNLDEHLKDQYKAIEDNANDEIDKINETYDKKLKKHQDTLQEITEQYGENLDDYEGFWDEVYKIMSGGQDDILQFLKDNSVEYKKASTLEKEAYLEGWEGLYSEWEKITGGLIKTPEQLVSEVGPTTGKDQSVTPLGTGANSGSKSSGSSGTPYPGSLIKKGSRGKDVEAIQAIVGTTVDGIFGDKTVAAVKAYQKKHSLAADGIVGPETWAKMFGSSGSKSKLNVSGISGQLSQGSKNSHVGTLQKALNEIMGSGLSVDNNFGPATVKALKAFQKKYKLSQDGILGPNSKAKFKALGYSAGGMVDYTGFAMVHGSKRKPEAFLNPEQTALLGGIMNALQKKRSDPIDKLVDILSIRTKPISIQPTFNFNGSGLSKTDGRKVGLDAGKAFDEYLGKKASQLGLTIPIIGSH